MIGVNLLDGHLLVFTNNRADRVKIRRHLPDLSGGRASCLLKRLRTHGLVKKIGCTHKYYVTAFGKEVIATALKLTELVIIPQLASGFSHS